MPEYEKTAYSVSQNFLTRAFIIEKLLDCAGISGEDRVLEIGAGKGHITERIAARCKFLTAVEIDKALMHALRRRLEGKSNVALENADFLKMRLPGGPYKVFSNLPFSVTTPCVLKLAYAQNPPEEAFLLMEQGAASRFVGYPRENARSLLLKSAFEADIRFRVARREFHPSPSCDAALLCLRKKPEGDGPLCALPPDERRRFEAFVSSALENARRGRPAFDGLLTKKQISRALREEGLSCEIRSGEIRSCEMLYVQWLCLFRCRRKFER